MLEAGMKTDDSAAVSALVKFAIQTNPYDKDEIGICTAHTTTGVPANSQP
ncbi:hypothetical protein ACFSHP_11905 [Novosphingobium panipatense]